MRLLAVEDDLEDALVAGRAGLREELTGKAAGPDSGSL
jgi:hypothetical protein